ncbi:MAG: UDP-N-acetylmuramate dehydrogenase [Pseudomonadota bacterium]|nr:UDP-N-acetylmuramate dehydrogenase [Pseudomonadota bacterium]
MNMTAPRGTLEHNIAMSGYTSWRAGGPADRLYKPADLDDLCAYLKTLPADEPVHFIGLGSNLLVRDGGLRGTVIFMHGALKEMRFEERRMQGRPSGAESRFGVVYAEAGVASPKVARFAANNNLTGAEFLAGIPGTVGGALAMNAGCYGHETWSYVSQVLTVDHQGNTHKRSPREFQVAYRHVDTTGRRREWFVAAWFLFPKGDGEAGRAEIKRLLERRIASQPLDLPNAGSVFRNPPGDYAARLIESCGMKGVRLGDAQVSEKHANFIVNLGRATATEIETLIEMVQEKVKAKNGVELIREVRILGDHVAPAYPQGVGRGCNAAKPPAATTSLSLPAGLKDAGRDAGATGGEQ